MKKMRLVLLSLLLLLILAPWVYANQVDLKIFYVNDFHGFAEPYKTAGGQRAPGGDRLSGGSRGSGSGKITVIIAGRRGYDPGEHLGQSVSGEIHH